MSFFSVLLSIITNPHLLRSLAGLLILAGTWYLCTALGLPSRTRLLIMVGVLLLVAFVQVLLTVRGRRKRNRAAADLESSMIMEADQSIVTAETGQKRVREDARRELEAAIEVLKRSQLADGRGGRAALYVLPWYLVLGSEYSGKSSLIRNSGLQPPDKGPGELRGIGASANFEWWFTNHAVLLEADKRFASVSGVKTAERDWEVFMATLRKQRPRVALNGVVITVSAADLMQGTPAEIDAQAKLMRRRLDLISNELNLILPVYLVVTKLDLVQGCDDYFAGLAGAGAEQIFGCTLRTANLRGAALEKTLAAELDLLYQQLCRRRQMRLVLEDYRTRRDGTYLFPLQLRGLGGNLQRFAQVLCESNVYGRNPLLRGFYFTSVGGAGRVSDLVRGELSRILGLPAPAGEDAGIGVPLFLRGFFRKVLLPDRDIARPTRGAARRMRHVRWVVQAAAFGALVLAGVWMWSRYANNRDLVQEIGDMTAKVAHLDVREFRKLNEVDGALTELDALRGRLAYLDERASVGAPLLNAGFYRGNDLNERARGVYLERFVDVVVPPLLADLRFYLLNYQDKTPDQYYDAYSVRKMLQRLDRADTSLVIETAQMLAVSGGASISASAQARLATHLRFALQHRGELQVLMERRNLVWEPKQSEFDSHLQAYFPSGLEAGNHYDSIIGRINADHRDLAYPLQKFAPDTRMLDLRDDPGGGDWREIPASFTIKGWSDHVSVALGDTQKLAADMQWMSETLRENRVSNRDDLLRAYVDDYLLHWQRFLSSVTLAPQSTLVGASNLLNEVEAKDSAYWKLLDVAARNLDFEDICGKSEPEVAKELSRITAAFKPLHDLLAGSRDKPPFSEYLISVKALREHIDKRKTNEPAENAAAFTRSVFEKPPMGDEDPIAAALAQADTASGVSGRPVNPECSRALCDYLSQPAWAAWQAYLRETETHLNRLWKAVHAQFADLRGKYPLVRENVGENTENVSLGRFAEFFRGDGTLQSFMDQHLSGYLESEGHFPKKRYNQALGLTEDARIALNNGARLGRVFFADDPKSPSFKFQVTAHRGRVVPQNGLLPPKTKFAFGGKEVGNDWGPDAVEEFDWPPKAGTGAEIRAEFANNGPLLKVNGGGSDWALFRLIDKADKKPAEAQEFELSWRITVPGHAAEAVIPLRFAMRREDHVFLRTSTEFSCPESLFR